ncbi:hypothetical protein ILYODFUR_000357 [Ilyodon furcidens]|uniref:Uncharacterized protein n=1 Tax=Ilyodon furcidens TaxID=33524 RepID=A0ABV0TR23_9TELE
MQTVLSSGTFSAAPWSRGLLWTGQQVKTNPDHHSVVDHFLILLVINTHWTRCVEVCPDRKDQCTSTVGIFSAGISGQHLRTLGAGGHNSPALKTENEKNKW